MKPAHNRTSKNLGENFTYFKESYNIIDLLLLLCVGVFIYAASKLFPDESFCLIKNIFHLPCPGCGMTRAFNCIFSGDLTGAFYYNSLSIPLFCFIIMSLIWVLADIIRKDNSYRRSMNKLRKPAFIIALILITIVNWIFNIYKDI